MADLNNKLEFINEKAKSNSKDFILECEKRYQSIIDKIVKKIIEEDGREIIMLAGPSSAGKTTTAKSPYSPSRSWSERRPRYSRLSWAEAWI